MYILYAYVLYTINVSHISQFSCVFVVPLHVFYFINKCLKFVLFAYILYMCYCKYISLLYFEFPRFHINISISTEVIKMCYTKYFHKLVNFDLKVWKYTVLSVVRILSYFNIHQINWTIWFVFFCLSVESFSVLVFWQVQLSLVSSL